jgi:hypothetical protein
MVQEALVPEASNIESGQVEELSGRMALYLM